MSSSAPTHRPARVPVASQPPAPITPGSPLDRLDRRITALLARSAVPFLRVALGIVFLWFGVLKFFPGLSPAEGLASQTVEVLTFGLVGPAISVPVLAVWECLIGIGLLTGRFLRVTLLLLAVQMAGTMAPLILFPGETFTQFPFAPTLEGQYIIKNLVLVGAAMVIGATVRGGEIEPEPAAEPAAKPDSDGEPAAKPDSDGEPEGETVRGS